MHTHVPRTSTTALSCVFGELRCVDVSCACLIFAEFQSVFSAVSKNAGLLLNVKSLLVDIGDTEKVLQFSPRISTWSEVL